MTGDMDPTMHLLLADSWDSLIPVVVFAIGVLFSVIQRAFQRSRRSDRSEPGGWEQRPEVLEEGAEVESGGRVLRRYVRPGPSTVAPPPLPTASSPWEQELERILQRRGPQAGQPGPPPLPTADVIETPEQQPYWETVRETLEHPIDHATSVEDLSARDLESAQTAPAPLSGAVESGERRVSGIDLEERVRRMMERVGGQVRHEIPVTATTVTAPKAQSPGPGVPWIGRLRNPVTARQAMLASFVLGRPKSLEA